MELAPLWEGRSTASAAPKGAPKCISAQQKSLGGETPEGVHPLGLRCAGAPQRGGAASNSSSENNCQGPTGERNALPAASATNPSPAAHGEARAGRQPDAFSRQSSRNRDVDTAGRVASAQGGSASGHTFRSGHFDDIMMVWVTVSNRDPRAVRPGPGLHAALPHPEHSFCVSTPGSTTCFGRMP
jgi:hypothetical protein